MPKKFGLDFGTTNSSIAISENGVSRVIEIDDLAIDPRVVRSMLYFLRRELTYSPTVPIERLNARVFKNSELIYHGQQQYSVGTEAVNRYLLENKNRKPGIRRKILTGRMIIPATSASSDQGRVDPVPEYYEEVDFGTGRLMQALKTALKSYLYKGTTIFGKFYPLEELISIYIGLLKSQAEKVIEQKLDEVVCGRPVHFLDDPIKDLMAQNRLEEALKASGFNKVSFVFEPVAAAKQFISEKNATAQTVFVFDFGGGTLDTAIIQNNKVLATDGVYIGGDLLNADILQSKLVKYFGSETRYSDSRTDIPRHIFEGLNSWYSIPNLNNPEMLDLLDRVKYKNSDPAAIDRLIYLITKNLGFDLYEAIENSKKELSNKDQTVIKFKSGFIDINEVLTRSDFEDIIRPRVLEIQKVVLKTLTTANLEPNQIDVVVKTGGSSLIPVFESMLQDIFGQDKVHQFENFTSIAAGLAL